LWLKSSKAMQGMVAHACNPSTQEAGVGYIVKPCLNKTKQNKATKLNSLFFSSSFESSGQILEFSLN
jgi:hypothetical protein